jgi:hypothetical protein
MADPRHRQVVTLLDRPIEQRAFPDWSMQLVAGDDLSEGDVDVWALASSRSLGDLAVGPADELISTPFRVAPRQTRSIGTFERLLAAGEAIVKRTRRLDNVTLEAVADEAGVTPQAAYRYFGEIDDLILLSLRLSRYRRGAATPAPGLGSCNSPPASPLSSPSQSHCSCATSRSSASPPPSS